MMKLRHISLLSALMLTLSSCAQTKFTALEQQQISVEDPTLFEQYEAFTVDFGAMRDKDYCFPLPVGKAQLAKDHEGRCCEGYVPWYGSLVEEQSFFW